MTVKTWPKHGEPKILGTDKTPNSKERRRFIAQEFINPYLNEVWSFSLFTTADGLWPSIVLPVTVDGEVIAVRQFRPGANQVTIELPGGNIDPKEIDNSPRNVAERELREETGYQARKIIMLAPQAFFEPFATIICYYPFLALDCSLASDQKLDCAEQGMEFVKFTLKEWLELIFAGKIPDSKSVTVTMMALPHILNKNPSEMAGVLLEILRAGN